MYWLRLSGPRWATELPRISSEDTSRAAPTRCQSAKRETVGDQSSAHGSQVTPDEPLGRSGGVNLPTFGRSLLTITWCGQHRTC